MNAPQRFANWLAAHEHQDPVHGWVYRYHSRSDAHSIALCRFVLEDLLNACEALRRDALANRVAYGLNLRHTFPGGKRKTLDLAVGTCHEVDEATRLQGTICQGRLERVLIACEAKTVMTEHAKSQPRVFDELASSQEIVHRGDRESIAAGLTIVNIAETFVSPLRQKGGDLVVSKHKQPRAAQRMVDHLRGLPMRDSSAGAGFDAYATILVECDNQKSARLWSSPPAPQPGDNDHYAGFVTRIARLYIERFASTES